MKTLIIIFLIYLLCKKKDAMGGLLRGSMRILGVLTGVSKCIWKATWMFWCKAIMEYQCVTNPTEEKDIRKAWASWCLLVNNRKKWDDLHPNKFEDGDEAAEARHSRYNELQTLTEQEWTDAYGSYGPTEGALIMSGISLAVGFCVFFPILLCWLMG